GGTNGAEDRDEGGVLRTDVRLEVATEPGREPGARSARTDRDLQLTAVDDRGRDERTRVGHVDDVQEDALACGIVDEPADQLGITGGDVGENRAREIPGPVPLRGDDRHLRSRGAARARLPRRRVV